MDRKAVRGIILPEEGYAEAMETVVEPYLAERMMTEFCERENGFSMRGALQTSQEALLSFHMAIQRRWKIQGKHLLFPARRLSRLYARALRAWAQLPDVQ